MVIFALMTSSRSWSSLKVPFSFLAATTFLITPDIVFWTSLIILEDSSSNCSEDKVVNGITEDGLVEDGMMKVGFGVVEVDVEGELVDISSRGLMLSKDVPKIVWV